MSGILLKTFISSFMAVSLTLGPKLFISDSEVWEIVHKTEKKSLKKKPRHRSLDIYGLNMMKASDFD